MCVTLRLTTSTSTRLTAVAILKSYTNRAVIVTRHWFLCQLYSKCGLRAIHLWLALVPTESGNDKAIVEYLTVKNSMY
jgi:hypothetical protein